MAERQRKTPAATLAKNKRHYLKMLAEGRCCQCGKADDRTREGRAKCAACNAKNHSKPKKPLTQEQRDAGNTTKREWEKMRKDAHLCVVCGRKDARTINGRIHCLQCAKRRAECARKRRNKKHAQELREARVARWKAAGLCSTCGGKKEEPDKAMCIDCRVRAKLRKARHKISNGWLPRGANGKCFQCNRAPAIDGKRLCQACYDKKIETLREVALRRNRKEQGELG